MFERRTVWFESGPFEKVVLDVFQYGAVSLFEVVDVLSVPTKIGGGALKKVYAI